MKLYFTEVTGVSLEWLKTMVSGERLEKSRSFRFEMDQRRCLCAEALLNYALSENFPELSRPVRLWRDEFQKPHIFQADRKTDIEFNLSHSGAYAVCLLSEKPAGVDIEQKKELPEYDRIAKRFFTEKEAAQIDSSDRFLQYWTLKESYVKAIGKGLRFPLNEVEIHMEDDKNVRFKGRDRSYTGRVYEDIPGYVLSVCKEEGEAFPEKLEKVSFLAGENR